MKKLLLLLFIGGLAYAQDNDYEQINLKFGVNLINGSASGNPFDFGEGPAFSNPYYFELEYRFNKSFSLGLVGTLNEWQPGDELNKTILSEKRDYFAADLDGKFYFKDAFNILQDWKWLDLYIHGGVGYFTADEGSLSLNIGPGLNIWFSEDVGLSLGGTSKWAIDDHPDFDTNYYQFTAGIAFRLRDKDFDNDAVESIDKLKPSLIFLDIILDEGTGFDILNRITHQDFVLVFVTAFQEYALTAFKFNAIDFILKPVSVSDLFVAIEKVKQNLKSNQFTSTFQVESVKKALNKKVTDYNFIAVPSTKKIDFLKLEDILYFESEGRYTSIHLTDQTIHVVSKNIGEYDKLLAPDQFFRIHKKYLINIKYIININNADGSYCELIGNVRLPVAKRRKEDLVRFLNIR